MTHMCNICDRMPRFGRGRMRGKRWITEIPAIRNFRPHGVGHDNLKTVILKIEELEALRLVDAQNLTQDEASKQMGVSRRTLWNDLKSARTKVARALLKGYAIRIECGDYNIVKDQE